MDHQEAADLLERVSAKEVATLDLLLQHKSTKQIARELQVSPRAIEERIVSVRRKWGTQNRAETALAYARLLQHCGQTTCGPPTIDIDAHYERPTPTDLPLSSVFQLDDVLGNGFESSERQKGGPEVLDTRFGKLWRIVAIPALAVLLGMVLIWGLAFARALGEVI
jgi:DNA-binding CsgD family transcriptional regulator